MVFVFVPVVATLLPLIKHDHWVFRIFDFPRLQIAVVSLITIGINIWLALAHHPLFWVLMAVSVACLIYQTIQIIAYTPLTRPQVAIYQGEKRTHPIAFDI